MLTQDHPVNTLLLAGARNWPANVHRVLREKGHFYSPTSMEYAPISEILKSSPGDLVELAKTHGDVYKLHLDDPSKSLDDGWLNARTSQTIAVGFGEEFVSLVLDECTASALVLAVVFGENYRWRRVSASVEELQKPSG